MRRASRWPKRSRASSPSVTGKAGIAPIASISRRVDPGAAAGQGVPEGLRPGSERAHDARARDHHPSAHAAEYSQSPARARPA